MKIIRSGFEKPVAVYSICGVRARRPQSQVGPIRSGRLPYAHIRDFFQVAPSHMHNFSVVENAILTPSLVNQLTLGVNYFLQGFEAKVQLGLSRFENGPGTGKSDINQAILALQTYF